MARNGLIKFIIRRWGPASFSACCFRRPGGRGGKTIVCIGVLSNNSPLYLVYLVFSEPPPPSPLKVGFFSEPQKHEGFLSLTTSYLLKVTKFLVKISQFEFLVMTEKIIFVFRLFEPAERKRGYILRSFIKRGFRITFSFFFYKKIIFFVCASVFLT